MDNTDIFVIYEVIVGKPDYSNNYLFSTSIDDIKEENTMKSINNLIRDEIHLPRRLILSILLALSVALSLTSCSNSSNINSVEQLLELDDIISYESIEIDIEYQNFLKEYNDQERDKWYEELDMSKLETIEELIPADEVSCYKIRYKSDEEEVVGYISLPNDYKDIKYPVLIYNRGGNGDFGSISDEEIPYYSRHGFIVMASQYRGVDGGTGFDEFGGSDVNDVIKLIDMAEMIDFSNGKIYMFGWSRGAMQTYIVLSKDERIDAAVAGAGDSDLILGYNERDDSKSMMTIRIGSYPEANPDEYIKRSAIYWPEKINTPLLIVHGTEDWRVLVHHSEDLYEAMIKLDKDVELRIFEGMDHGEPYWSFLGEYLQWLKKY